MYPKDVILMRVNGSSSIGLDVVEVWICQDQLMSSADCSLDEDETDCLPEHP